MNAIAKTKYVRMSPRKVRIVLDKIKGLNVTEAYKELKFMDKRAAKTVEKTLKSAVANAGASDIPERVKVKRVWVGKGPAMKRLRPRAMGRADIYKRPTSHIEIEVG